MIKEIKSKKIGLIQYRTEDIITFPEGLLGFEDFKEYLLIKNNTSEFFIFLQSVDDPNLTFIIIQPTSVMPEYVLDVVEEGLEQLDLQHVLDFAIVTIPEAPKEMMMNLLGPILIDIKNQIGKQVISIYPDYTTKHKILTLDNKERKVI